LTVKLPDDDAAYVHWIAANPAGFVINIQAGLNASDARLHLASCRTISRENPRRGPWIGKYIKVCSVDLDALDRWAVEHARGEVVGCGTCHPGRASIGRKGAPETAPRKHPPARGQSRVTKMRTLPGIRRVSPDFEGHAELREPLPRWAGVEAWADDYIRFEDRPDWQDELRGEIRKSVRQLRSRPQQVLHATFFGAKHPTADVENLALYYIDDTGRSFAEAAGSGLRFELAAHAPVAPSGREFPYCYRYELVSRDAGFEQWRERRRLAAWDWVELGRFAGEKKLEQVWLALARTAVSVVSPKRQRDVPFAVRTSIRVPRNAKPALGYLVKGVFDGVVCAFQAHADESRLAELARRVSRSIPADQEEIAALLRSEEQAVLGTVPRLLHRRGKGVIWAPADDMCVAGELLAETTRDVSWAIKGEIAEVEPA
jgi:hypothetical protein